MSRAVQWLNAINTLSIMKERLFEIHLQDLNKLSEVEFDWFKSLIHRASDDLDSLREATENVLAAKT